MSDTSEEILELIREFIGAPELQEPRCQVCRVLATELGNCGARLWAFGAGPADFRTACSIVLRIGGSLASGAVAMGEHANWYAGSALVRQFVEVEYLVRLFREDSGEAVRWLKASTDQLRASFQPRHMRERAKGFRHEEYRAHCEIGGHPSPRAHTLLPDRVLNQHSSPLGNEVFWVDLAQHLRRVWRDIAALPKDHPAKNLEVIAQYTDAVTTAISEWETVDPYADDAIVDHF